MTAEVPAVATEDILAYYREQYRKFEEATRQAFFVCYGISDLLVRGGRPKYRGILYTKLCVSARSLLRLAPEPDSPKFRTAHMDLSGGAALARVIIDTFVSLYHIGLDRCSAEEFEARELLVFWRDLHVRKKMGAIVDWGDDREVQQNDVRYRLIGNSFFSKLPKERQKHLLKKGDLLHSPEQILGDAGFAADQIRSFYAYLSAHAHCDSVSFLFVAEQKRGRGFPSDADLALLGVCFEQSCAFVMEGARLVEQAAPGAEARGRSIANLDPLEDVAGPQWWAGKKLSELVPGMTDD